MSAMPRSRVPQTIMDHADEIDMIAAGLLEDYWDVDTGDMNEIDIVHIGTIGISETWPGADWVREALYGRYVAAAKRIAPLGVTDSVTLVTGPVSADSHGNWYVDIKAVYKNTGVGVHVDLPLSMIGDAA